MLLPVLLLKPDLQESTIFPTKLAPEPCRLTFACAGIAVTVMIAARETTNNLAYLEILTLLPFMKNSDGSDVLEKNTPGR